MNSDEVLSLTLRIIEGGMKGDIQKVANYAEFLAEKLLAEGELGQARRVLDTVLGKGSKVKAI